MLFLLTLLLILPQSGFCSSTLVLPSRTVVIKLPYVNATIPCSYTSPDDVTTTTWTRGGVNGPTVLQRSSSGTVEPGVGYEDAVSFGEKCSLVFKSPKLTDDGDYTITIHNDGDWSETVRVVVVEGNATVYSSALPWTLFGVLLFLMIIICIVMIVRRRRSSTGLNNEPDSQKKLLDAPSKPIEVSEGSGNVAEGRDGLDKATDETDKN